MPPSEADMVTEQKQAMTPVYTEIPIGSCDPDFGNACYELEYLSPEEAATIFSLAREASHHYDAAFENRCLDLAYMRYN